MVPKVPAIWLSVLIATMFLAVQQAFAMNHNCLEDDCVPLQECPELANLLRIPSASAIRTLQAATCFIERSIPMVCCKSKRIAMPTPPANKNPMPSPAKHNHLIPYKPGSCGQGTTRGLHRIFGGEEAPLGGYPWIAALGYTEVGFSKVEYLCSGSIINERYILTAAHCVEPSILSIKKLAVISVGDWDLASDVDCERTSTGLETCSPPSQNFTHEEIIVHPLYNTRASHSDDIALVRLSSSMDISGKWIHPVCLPPQGLDIKRLIGDRDAVVAGWGTTESGQGSSRLLHVLLPLEEVSFCNETYSGTMVKEQICFGGDSGRDSCSGDSGGPLVLGGPTDQPPFLLIGIVSYGPSSCGQASFPGVYTSVADYRVWIESNVRA